MGLDLSTCVCVEDEIIDSSDKNKYELWDTDVSPDLKNVQQTIATQIMVSSVNNDMTTIERADMWLLRTQVFDYVSSGDIRGLEKVISDPRVRISTFVWKVLHCL